MDNLLSSIMKVCEAAKLISGSLLVLSLIVIGLSTYFGSPQTKELVKDKLKLILGGSALIFGSSYIGAYIVSLFV